MSPRLDYEIGAKALKGVLTSLLLFSAAIGSYIITTDKYLWAAAPSHAYGLIAFIAMDVVASATLYVLPRLSRVIALLLPAIQFVAMAGDLYMGLGSPGSLIQSGFREYLLNDTAFMALLVLQAGLVGLAAGYLVQRPDMSPILRGDGLSKRGPD